MVALLCIAMLSSFGVTPVKAQSSTAQSEQIKTLLALIQQLQAQLAQMQGGGSSVSQCLTLSRALYLGVSDSETAGEVSKLQQFLTKTGHYTYGKPTGYFGPATQMAVQAWQKTNDVVSSGSPETTGFGVTGPSTRSAMARSCTSTYTPTNRPVVEETENSSVTITSISNSENPTVTGKASGVDTVGFAVSDGGKVYGSGDIDVENGVWLHKITKDLEDGEYTLIVYVNNSKVAQKTFVVDVVQANPSITLTSPKRDAVFNKNEANDDVVIKWTAQDVPENTNVLYEIEATQSYAGAFVTGSAGQVKAKSGSSEHRIAIDIAGTLDAGEYKVRLKLQECHSLGCDKSYTFGPLEEDLETYDTSSYGYFTIIDSDSASVNLVPVGRGDTDELDANITDSLEFYYYPTGDIDECLITAKYSGGKDTLEHPWSNTILAGQYGRVTFNVVSTYPLIVLEEVKVECKDDNGNVVASDAIDINVDNDAESSYAIILNGSNFESGDGISEAETRSRCLKVLNDNSGKRVQCSWDGDEFFDDTNWKG